MLTTDGNLPHWSGSGVLPPVWPGESGGSPKRSPYRVSLAEFTERFAASPDRIAILGGLLCFRKKIHELGMVSGFQWLDGSFLERIELLEYRSPRDLDVVTFFEMPCGETQGSLAQKDKRLFEPGFLKKTYAVDGYFCELGGPVDAQQIRRIAYWYSMWSHRRDGLWKGFVQVDLDPSQDDSAQEILNANGGVRHE